MSLNTLFQASMNDYCEINLFNLKTNSLLSDYEKMRYELRLPEACDNKQTRKPHPIA